MLGMQIRLRAVRLPDLPVFFEHQCDAEAADMAGFVPRARSAFDEHWCKIMSGPMFIVRTIEADGKVAGYVSAFPRDDRSEIAYWLGREYWGKGIGKAAVEAFLKLHLERPLFGAVSIKNLGSLAILRRCGFEFYAEETGADGFQEHILRLS
ncbi:GNAT family N-acetyltransferase [Novosphingobium sp. RD2P27]|uniref:GNAT family N-acetyltransferase n=1 Tax=Novosphingobium kalidii TaxID=3230299 RepID=A0ABV2D2K9_9SPHN